MVSKQVKEIMDKTPILKAQRDIVEMTEEEQKDKAAEMIKSGMLPILGGM